MKSSLIIGLLLIALGAAALIYKNISYKSEETVVQLGSLKATAETEKNIPVPDWLGFGLTAAGVLLVAIGGRK